MTCTKRGIKWPTQSSRNDKRYKKHSGTTSHELVFSTCECEKRKKRRRVRSAQRERKTNKLRTVTRSVNLKQHVTPDPAELFGFSLENSQREHLTYGFFILLLQDVVVIRVFLRGLSAIIHRDHGEVGGHFLTMWGVCLSPYLSVSPSASASAPACLSSGSKFSVVLLSLWHRLDHVTRLSPYKEAGKPRPVGRP